MQGYTNISIPNHRTIQETLVKLKDKDPSFIGSDQWIGALEVMMVLQNKLNV